MDTLRQFGRLALVLMLMVVSIWGCEEETTVAPPPPPEQITLQRITGMASDDVFDVFVDSQQRLWVSTDRGVYLFPSTTGPYDVSKATWFSDRDGIPNLQCRGMSELNGKVYVATWGGGLGIYDNATPWLAVPATDTLLTGRVYEMAPDDTSLWLATVSRVTQYIDNGKPTVEERLVDHGEIFGDRKFCSIVVRSGVGGHADSTQIWVAQETGDSLGVPIPGGMKLFGLPDTSISWFRPGTSGIPSANVLDVEYDPTRDVVWSAHPGKGVATVDLEAKKWKTYTEADGLVSDLAVSVAINKRGIKWPAGTVWIATQAGVTKMAPDGSMVNYSDGSGLPTLHVRRVVVDRNDHVWLCFADGGAAKVVPPAK